MPHMLPGFILCLIRRMHLYQVFQRDMNNDNLKVLFFSNISLQKVFGLYLLGRYALTCFFVYESIKTWRHACFDCIIT